MNCDEEQKIINDLLTSVLNTLEKLVKNGLIEDTPSAYAGFVGGILAHVGKEYDQRFEEIIKGLPFSKV